MILLYIIAHIDQFQLLALKAPNLLMYSPFRLNHMILEIHIWVVVSISENISNHPFHDQQIK